MFACVVGLLILPSFIEGCGKRFAGTRVIGGQDAFPHSWPWQISLRVNGRHSCGGTLIMTDWVVTAGHCVHGNLEPSGYTVVVGAHHKTGITNVQQTFHLKQLLEHEGYTTKLKNDIALIQLDRPVTLSDKVNVACLPSGEIPVGSKCYITGWGRMYGGSGRPGILQQAMLPIASYKSCRKQYRIDRLAHLCAGEARAGASGGCNGDSGGPLVCEEGGRWVLHGAVSYGARYCPTEYYTVFTRISSYVDWIKTKMSGSGTGGGQNTPEPPATQEPATQLPQTNPPTDCKDNGGGCSDMTHLCHASFMKRYCRRTCNLC